MEKYIVREVENVNSFRKGTEIEAKNLSEAKRKASKMQVFLGTVLVIEYLSGVHAAIKRSGKWEEPMLFEDSRFE